MVTKVSALRKRADRHSSNPAMMAVTGGKSRGEVERERSASKIS